MVAKDGEVLNVLIASGLLGLRTFWKVSAVSKKLLSLRDNTTTLGLGSVCLGFSSASEREEVSVLMDACFEKDDVKALQQVLALNGVSGRYPFLLKRCLKKSPNSAKCVEFLTQRGPTSLSADFSEREVSNLSAERVSHLIEHGIVSPDSWVWDSNLCCLQILQLSIGVRNIEAAERILQAGARVDTFYWGASSEGEIRMQPDTPLHTLVRLLGIRLRKSASENGHDREKGLPLLGRMAKAAKASGYLHWKARNSRREQPLLDTGAPRESYTALGLACTYRDTEAVRVLIDATNGVLAEGEGGQVPYLVFEKVASDQRGSRGITNVLIDTQCEDTLQALMSLKGIDLNRVQKGFDRHSPLSLACALGMEKSAEVLLKNGALPEKVKRGFDFANRSPLVEALLCDSEPVLALLLKWKAKTKVTVMMNGKSYTPLQLVMRRIVSGPPRPNISSAESRNTATRLARLLVSNGAQCSFATEAEAQESASPSVSTSKISPLLLACEAKDPDLVRLFLSKGGADPNLPGELVDSPADFQPQPPGGVDMNAAHAALLAALGVLPGPPHPPQVPPPLAPSPFPMGVPPVPAPMPHPPAQGLFGAANAAAPTGPATQAQTHRRGVNPISPVAFVLESVGSNENDASVAVELLEALVERGADLSSVNEDGHSALSLACKCDCSPPTLVFLLEKGVGVGVGRRDKPEPRRVPLVEAVRKSCQSRSLRSLLRVCLLLEKGVDANECGLASGEYGKEVLMSPLEAALCESVPRTEPEGPELLQHIFSVVKLLVSHGGKCSSAAQSPSEGVGGIVPPLSLLSKVCQMGDAPLLQLLLEKGGAAPKGEKELTSVLAVLLCDRANMSQKKIEEGGALRQWRTAENLLREGGHLDSRLGFSFPFDWRKSVWTVSRFGSGSWLANLIDVEDSRGSLLLRIIRSLPKIDLEEPFQCLGEGVARQGDFCPLVNALRSGWEEGAVALLDRGVDVNRRKVGMLAGARVQSPLSAALNTKQWDLARRLLEKGACLAVQERRTVEGENLLATFPADVQTAVKGTFDKVPQSEGESLRENLRVTRGEGRGGIEEMKGQPSQAVPQERGQTHQRGMNSHSKGKIDKTGEEGRGGEGQREAKGRGGGETNNGRGGSTPHGGGIRGGGDR
uniref:Uncharacterized protein n=1 Tax=Chromera velia CCMP2878 TaxID=1169474 RepID=A0A0G4G697_9ALVE|eukprot:Cvel_4235.t1-p1 / transcript=Cvel_4235.t1 / gene=Cvel_4235 / organism=Chromera_velia_CCMP2878 / gene_product=hypothetical protein / transcript_product=hypothetical protein / location=Cvel_scaffold183:40809-45162(-) / protein_length=1141 / sequence_SO=supercontig / SO=protein_coding / is_pseudo=false